MAFGATNKNGYTKTGFLLVAFLVLAIAFVGGDNVAKTARATDSQGQLALGIISPDVKQFESKTAPSTDLSSDATTEQGPICSGGKNDPAMCSSKYVTRYVEQQGGTPREAFCAISPNVIRSVCAKTQSDAECSARVDQLVSVLTEARGDIGVEGVGKTCNNKYRGALTCFELFSAPPTDPKSLQTTAPAPPFSQVAAAVLAQEGGGEMRCCKKDDAQCKNNALKAIQAGGRGQNSLLQRMAFDPDNPGVSVMNAANTDSTLTDATNVAFGDGNGLKPASVFGAKAVEGGVKSASRGGVSVIQSGNQFGATTQITRSSQSYGSSNPVTRTPGASAVQRSGAGIAQTYGSYQPTGQSRFQSLQRPQLFQPAPGAITGNNQSAQQPSIVERFARLIGADQRLFARQTPQGYFYDTPVERSAPQTTFIIRPQDAHIRSIQEIASDVAQNTTPGGSRVDHFAQTLNAVGGPNTSGRKATTTNSAYGKIQDLIVEDEAIRAMFVAEQTAKRAKNSVFCLQEEKSKVCQVRRSETAKRVERQTFVEELNKRNLPQPALEHFLAVYDGWVSPTTPAPKSNPVLLSGAFANSGQSDASQLQTATSTNFVSWAWSGVKSGAQKMLDALAAWLTP